MAPSISPLNTTSELIKAGVEHTILKTAPSLTTNGTNGTNGTKPLTNVHENGHLNGYHSTIAELDASKLIFTRNTNPKAVPEPNSPEVWSQSEYA